MLEILGEAFVQVKPWQELDVLENRGVIVEHIHVSKDRLEICGEHIMAEAGPLYLYPDFFGAERALL